jgi:hypothetical protein
VRWDFGYCGHNWHIVPAPDDRWGWLWRNWWNEDWQGKLKYSEKTCPSATLSTTNPTWLDPVLNTGRRGGKPATNRLSYGAAFLHRIEFRADPFMFLCQIYASHPLLTLSEILISQNQLLCPLHFDRWIIIAPEILQTNLYYICSRKGFIVTCPTAIQHLCTIFYNKSMDLLLKCFEEYVQRDNDAEHTPQSLLVWKLRLCWGSAEVAIENNWTATSSRVDKKGHF